MLTCYRCGKPIHARAVSVVPSRLSLQLRAYFPRAYHPACHARAEKEAAAALRTVKA